MIIRLVLCSRIIKASAVTALALMVFYSLAQQGASLQKEKPEAEQLLAKQKTLYDTDAYKQLLVFSDTIIEIFKDHNLRVEWYKALRLKTIARNNHGEADLAVTELLPIASAQVIDDSITAKIYGLAGFACLNTKSIELGGMLYELSLVGLLKHNCKTALGTAYMNIGFYYKQKGDYQEAKTYYLAALNHLKAETNYYNWSEALINLGDISRFTGEYEASKNYYYQAAEVYPENYGRLESNLGWCHADAGKPAEALRYFQISVHKSELDAETARGMGKCYEALGDTQKANAMFREAYAQAQSAIDTAKAVVYMGNASLSREHMPDALKNYQKALHFLYPEVSSADFSQNPTASDKVSFWMVQSLQGKAEALLKAPQSSEQSVFLAEQTIRVAMNALDSFRWNMQNDVSNQDALDYAYSTYETGIQSALALEKLQPGNGYLGLAYERAERSKSGLLKRSFLESEIRQVARVPEYLLLNEKGLVSSITTWETLKQSDSLLIATRKLQKLRDSIETLVPALGKTRLQAQLASLAEIQQTLSQGEVLLQYFWGNEQVMVFALDKYHLHAIPLVDVAKADAIIDSLGVYLGRWTDPLERYQQVAQQTYQALCAPAMALFPNARRLLIVPDGPLFSVPFEALVNQNQHFLAEEHSISYHWSGALWRQSRLNPGASEGNTEYGGFAPEYNSPAVLAAVMGPEVTDLPEARVAVSNAGKIWEGQVWQGPEVSKSLFQQEAGKFGVLHLAMHGVLDSAQRTRTGLLFPGQNGDVELLNALEISQMDLAAKVAVLSACHTAGGKVHRGEGVMSLSRSFALAGCPAVVANLWAVPSEETNAIAERFMALLHKGKAKDAALRQAKQEYLATAMKARKHPYFWAGQVLVGNEAPVQKSMGWLLTLLLGGIAGVIGVFAWLRRKR
jgi:CHAT domain-containing protein